MRRASSAGIPLWLRAGATSLLLAGAPAGCQGEYPLEPTACDHWCDASKPLRCGSYEPAECVSQCEFQGISQGACADVLEAAVTCLRDTPDLGGYCQGAWGYQPEGRPCSRQEYALLACAEQQLRSP